MHTTPASRLSRPSRALPLLGLAAALLALPSCIELASFPGGGGAGRPVVTGPVTAGDTLLAQGAEAYRKGDYAAAARAYTSFLARNPSSPDRQEALYGAAVSKELSRDYAGAVSDYTRLLGEFPDGARSAAARDRLPQALVAAGRPQEALDTARANIERDKGAPPRTLAPQKVAEGNALWLLGRYPAAAESFAAALAAESPDARAAAARGLNASFRHMSQDELGQFARRYGQNTPGPEAVWFMAYQSAQAGDAATFAAQAQYFRTYFPSHPWGARLAELEAAAGGSAPPPPDSDFEPKAWLPAVAAAPAGAGAAPGGAAPGGSVIAAVLPLSGDNNSRFASEVLEGLKLAVAGTGVTVLEMDTGGAPAGAVRLVGEAAANPAVVAVVGPLASPEALAAAQTAQQSGIPLIAVSQRLGLVNGRPLVFRVFLTPKHQAEAAAADAAAALKATARGGRYPADGFGR
ncbi:MAG: ABC transporter substrate-binding protein, partial [Deltaproteobacteria bacterium]|nr:ABC transporter substrate-binding protein [Deltaproteobacteria bacterium]